MNEILLLIVILGVILVTPYVINVIFKTPVINQTGGGHPGKIRAERPRRSPWGPSHPNYQEHKRRKFIQKMDKINRKMNEVLPQINSSANASNTYRPHSSQHLREIKSYFADLKPVGTSYMRETNTLPLSWWLQGQTPYVYDQMTPYLDPYMDDVDPCDIYALEQCQRSLIGSLNPDQCYVDEYQKCQRLNYMANFR